MMWTVCSLAILAAFVTPAFAEISPSEQFESGIEIQDIQCNPGKTLLESPRSKPSCVSEDTAAKLVQRGWSIIRVFEDEVSKDATESHVEDVSVDPRDDSELYITNSISLASLEPLPNPNGIWFPAPLEEAVSWMERIAESMGDKLDHSSMREHVHRSGEAITYEFNTINGNTFVTDKYHIPFDVFTNEGGHLVEDYKNYTGKIAWGLTVLASTDAYLDHGIHGMHLSENWEEKEHFIREFLINAGIVDGVENIGNISDGGSRTSTVINGHAIVTFWFEPRYYACISLPGMPKNPVKIEFYYGWSDSVDYASLPSHNIIDKKVREFMKNNTDIYLDDVQVEIFDEPWWYDPDRQHVRLKYSLHPKIDYYHSGIPMTKILVGQCEHPWLEGTTYSQFLYVTADAYEGSIVFPNRNLQCLKDNWIDIIDLPEYAKVRNP